MKLPLTILSFEGKQQQNINKELCKKLKIELFFNLKEKNNLCENFSNNFHQPFYFVVFSSCVR